MIQAAAERATSTPKSAARVPSDDLVVAELLRARSIAFALQRIALEAPAELAGKCSELAEGILSGISDAFGPEIAR